ncbi:MAG: tRNA-dihydrouridine synthase family protein [Chlamydiae bacterium]|nr:tRNA-dihydrouridine synthase family protein [Chlamydiota bacterium]
MEGVGDRTFRKAMASVGGFDEAVMDFLSVPKNAHVPSLAKKYESDELLPIPIAAQLMGSDPNLMAAMAKEMEKRGAKRVDLNCGCPSNTVTGNGSGSSLLKNPNLLHTIAKAMVDAVNVPVTVKMRSGYEDTSLFEENLKAAESSGIKFLTLHPRTKIDGYGPPAKWEYIAKAKEILKIPVVGNGDILTVSDALNMLKQTNCDALMIGRGSVANPFIFHEIKAHFSNTLFQPSLEALLRYIDVFVSNLPEDMQSRGRINKMKQLFGFIFTSKNSLKELRKEMLTFSPSTLDSFLGFAIPLLKKGWVNESQAT